MFQTGLLSEVAVSRGAAVDAQGGSPLRAIRRRAQFGKFFGYLLNWNPLANGAIDQIAVVNVNSDGAYFEVLRMAALATNYGVNLKLQVSPAGQFLFRGGDGSIPLSHLGSGRLPSRLFHPGQLILSAQGSVLTGLLSDRTLAGLAQTVWVELFGQKVYRDPVVQEVWYNQGAPGFYLADRTAQGENALTANQAVVTTIRTGGDADFEIQKMTITADGAITVNVQTAADWWFDTDVRFELLGGSTPENPASASGEYPFILPAPRLVYGANGITVRLTDISGLAANRVKVMFHGTLLFPAGGVDVIAVPGNPTFTRALTNGGS